MTAPEVSIVNVASSVQAELERCLESIHRRAQVLIETVLVDASMEVIG